MLSYIKMKFMIMIMREMNILTIEEIENEFYIFKLNNNSTKTDLDKSNILKKLRAQQKRSFVGE